MSDVDAFLDSEDLAVKQDEERPGAWRTAWCPCCGRDTRQQFWPHRGGWICHDDGEGCGRKVISQHEYDEAEETPWTGGDIWGRRS